MQPVEEIDAPSGWGRPGGRGGGGEKGHPQSACDGAARKRKRSESDDCQSEDEQGAAEACGLGEDYESQAHPTESYPEASRGEGGQEEGSGGGSTLERPASPEVEYDGEEWWVVGGGQAEPEVQVWWQGAEPEPQVAAGEQEVQEQEHEGGWHHVADAEEEEPIDEFDFDELIELLHGPSPSGSPYPYDWEEGQPGDDADITAGKQRQVEADGFATELTVISASLFGGRRIQF